MVLFLPIRFFMVVGWGNLLKYFIFGKVLFNLAMDVGIPYYYGVVVLHFEISQKQVLVLVVVAEWVKSSDALPAGIQPGHILEVWIRIAQGAWLVCVPL